MRPRLFTSLSAHFTVLPATFLFFSLIACSLPPTKTRALIPPAAGPSQTGIASWYGPGFHGRPTASGAIYDQHDLTAAHQTLPLGTRVMVTNLDNGRSVEVTINDRGPFVKGRIIDLSYAAGRVLGMIGPGTVPVRVEVIDSGSHRITSIRERLDYTLQLGSFIRIENAYRLKEQLTTKYPQIAPASIIPLHGKGAIYYRVQVGTFPNRQNAEGHAQRLAAGGFSVIIMEK